MDLLHSKFITRTGLLAINDQPCCFSNKANKNITKPPLSQSLRTVHFSCCYFALKVIVINSPGGYQPGRGPTSIPGKQNQAEPRPESGWIHLPFRICAQILHLEGRNSSIIYMTCCHLPSALISLYLAIHVKYFAPGTYPRCHLGRSDGCWFKSLEGSSTEINSLNSSGNISRCMTEQDSKLLSTVES